MDNFKAELDHKLNSGIVTEYSNFRNVFIQVLNNYAPAKKENVRFNMTKTLRNATMHRTRLKNIYICKRNDKNRENYKKQRNFCVDLLRKTKTEYTKNLNVKDLPDNRKFWKTIKSYFSNNGLNINKFLLKEKGNLVSNEKELVTILNNSFINITKNVELKKNSKGKLNNLEDILNAFESHLSIEKIKKAINTTEKFSFRNVKDDEVRKFIMNLDGSKATPAGNIPTDMLKQTIDIHLPIMTQIINMYIENNCYPDDVKLAEVSPVFKKKDDLDKENYRPVSVLSHVPKVLERIMYQQIEDFMKDKLLNLLTGFTENHNNQHCLMSMLERWKKTLDKEG